MTQGNIGIVNRLRRRSAGMLVVVWLTLTACATTSTPSVQPTQTPAPPSPTVTATPAPISGRFDVGGYSLAMSCIGSGSPTVVYLHGLDGSSRNAGTIPTLLVHRTRVCVYDRANAGQSDHVAGKHTAADSARELHRLLAAAQVAPPYVLVGASFGGLIAIDYAGLYPDETRGLVLLDSLLPTDAETDHFIPVAQREAYVQADEGNAEGARENASLDEAKPLVAKIPDIPVTYLEASQLDLPVDWPVADMTAAIFALRQDFVSGFRQGSLVMVDSPHYMEPVVPQQIANEVRDVLDLIAEHS